jgi:hypothetical protein
MDQLITYVDDGDPPSVETVLAIALRAALGECGEEQAFALHGVDPRQETTYRLYCAAKLEVANKVVRRIGEALERLPAKEVTP